MDGSDAVTTGRTLTHQSPPLGCRFSLGSRVGPYSLLQFLGKGAFGEVWLAERDSVIARSRLAVKLPLSSSIDMAAVRREAEAWVRAGNHPNVLPMFEADIYDGQVAIVSEYAPDGTLKRWLDGHSGRAPSVEAAAGMAAGILAGLAHLHARGVIHRDLKPANILMQGQCPRIADFGLARLTDALATGGAPSGTPAYMAPEAFDGERSTRTDVWAAGVILHEMIAGVRPFPQGQWMALVRAISTAQPGPLPPGTPAHVEHVVRRCLEKDPALRYQTAEAVLCDLRAAATPPAPPGLDTLLHRVWDDLDPDLQDALALAHNQARRERKDRISTRTFFAALARLRPGRLPEMLARLPGGAMPDPAEADFSDGGRILQDGPKLSTCVENALLHLGEAKGPGHKLGAEEVFVDVAKFGTGPSVIRLRSHGVTPEMIDGFVRQLGWQVVHR